MTFSRLPTLNGIGPREVSKPRPVIEDRIAYKRDRDQQDRDFRAAVWQREKGVCQYRPCGRIVKHTLAAIPERGEVHHLRGRNVAPEDRWNPDAAVLLCLICHGRAQRHEITVTR